MVHNWDKDRSQKLQQTWRGGREHVPLPICRMPASLSAEQVALPCKSFLKAVQPVPSFRQVEGTWMCVWWRHGPPALSLENRGIQVVQTSVPATLPLSPCQSADPRKPDKSLAYQDVVGNTQSLEDQLLGLSLKASGPFISVCSASIGWMAD